MKRHLHMLRKTLAGNVPLLIMACLYTIIAYGHITLGLPAPEVIAQHLQKLYQSYGIYIVALGLFVEGFFMLGFYFPGSFILVMAVLLAPKTIASIGGIALLAITMTMLISVLNYYLGAKGFYKLFLKWGGKKLVNDMHRKLEKNLTRTIYLSAWHPNFLAIAVICCGVSQIGLLKTLRHIILPVVFWLTAWIAGVALFMPLDQLTGKDRPHLIAIVLWTVVVVKCIHTYRNLKAGKNG